MLGRGVWPGAPAERAQARGLCADIHSGFTALRQHCPMNVSARLPAVGARVWQEQADLREDVHHLLERCASLLQNSSGPMLFGAFSIADAFYAPVCMRLTTFALPVPQPIADYVRRVQALPGVKDWIDGALAEADFREFEEPYRLRR